MFINHKKITQTVDNFFKNHPKKNSPSKSKSITVKFASIFAIFLFCGFIQQIIYQTNNFVLFLILKTHFNNNKSQKILSYFPKQNLEKISSIISSVTTSPVIFDKSSKISLIKIDTISRGIPD